MVVAMMAAVRCVENGLVRLESSSKRESFDLSKICKKNGMQNIRFFDDSSREAHDIKQLESSQPSETSASSRLHRPSGVNGHCQLQDRKIPSTIVFAKPLLPSLRSRQLRGTHCNSSPKETKRTDKTGAPRVRCDRIGVRTRRSHEKKPCHLIRVGSGGGGLSGGSASPNNKRPTRCLINESVTRNGISSNSSSNNNNNSCSSRRTPSNGLTLRGAGLLASPSLSESCRRRMGVLCADQGCNGEAPCSCVDVSTGSPRPASLPSPPSPGVHSRKRSMDFTSSEDDGTPVTRRCLQRSPSAGSLNGAVYHIVSRSKAGSDLSSSPSSSILGHNGLNGFKLGPHDHTGKLGCMELDLKSKCSKCMDHHHPNHMTPSPSPHQTNLAPAAYGVASTSSPPLTHSPTISSSSSSSSSSDTSSNNLRKGSSSSSSMSGLTSSVLSPTSTGSSGTVEVGLDSDSPSSLSPLSPSSPSPSSQEQDQPEHQQKQELQQQQPVFAQGTLSSCEGSAGRTCHSASPSSSSSNANSNAKVTMATTNKSISVSVGDTFPNLRQRSHSGNSAKKSSTSGVSWQSSSVLLSSSSSSSSLLSTLSANLSSSASSSSFSSKQQTNLPKSKSMTNMAACAHPLLSLSSVPSNLSSLSAASPASDPSSPSSSSTTTVPATVQCKWRGCSLTLDASDLLDHVRRHAEAQIAKEKYACLWTECKVYEKAASSASWLERHVVTHSGHRPFKCILPNCGQRFHSQAALERHVNGHFAASGQGASKPARSREEVNHRLFLKRKKQLKRRSVQSVKPIDFFDGETMSVVKQELLTLSKYTDNRAADCPLQVTFLGTVLGRRTNPEGTKQSLIEFSPTNVLESRWVSEGNCTDLSQMSVPLAFLPPDTVANLHQSLYRQHRFRKHRRK